MATVPTSLLDELTDEVNRLSASAQDVARSALVAILDDWERNGGGDAAALREAAYEAIDGVLAYYADTCAAARAAEYYDAIRKAQGFPGSYSAVAEPLRNPEATLEALRAFVGKAAEGKAQTFLTLCLQRVDSETRRAANKCVAYNASKDPAKPWYGRVPRGETCGFCLMLASFGFYAKTVAMAEHSHPNCDCRIVPGFPDKTRVKSYDPDGMYARYSDCLSALGGESGLNTDWAAMPKADRDAHIAAHGNSEGKARRAYQRKRIAAEIETRDAGWYKTGTAPSVGYSSEQVKARVTAAERWTATRLTEHGVRPVFVQDYVTETCEDGVKRKVGLPDLSNGTEIKTIGTSGNAWGAVKNYMDSAKGKRGLQCLLIDNSMSEKLRDDDVRQAIEALAPEYEFPEIRMVAKSGEYFIVAKKNRRSRKPQE